MSGHVQRQGIAEKLLATFEQAGKEKGYKLFTTNYQKWAPWSGRFYLKHGYKEYVSGDEVLCSDLIEPVRFYKKIGKLNNDHNCFVWKIIQ